MVSTDELCAIAALVAASEVFSFAARHGRQRTLHHVSVKQMIGPTKNTLVVNLR
jgi:hypothetical protein